MEKHQAFRSSISVGAYYPHTIAHHVLPASRLNHHRILTTVRTQQYDEDEGVRLRLGRWERVLTSLCTMPDGQMRWKTKDQIETQGFRI